MIDRMDEDTKLIVAKLREYKMRPGNTLTALATAAGMSQSVVSQMHRGRVDRLTPANIKKLLPFIMPDYGYGLFRRR